MSGKSKREGGEGGWERKERGSNKTKHLKSLDSTGIRCQVEKNQGTDKTKTCWKM